MNESNYGGAMEKLASHSDGRKSDSNFRQVVDPYIRIIQSSSRKFDSECMGVGLIPNETCSMHVFCSIYVAEGVVFCLG